MSQVLNQRLTFENLIFPFWIQFTEMHLKLLVQILTLFCEFESKQTNKKQQAPSFRSRCSSERWLQNVARSNQVRFHRSEQIDACLHKNDTKNKQKIIIFTKTFSGELQSTAQLIATGIMFYGKKKLKQTISLWCKENMERIPKTPEKPSSKPGLRRRTGSAWRTVQLKQIASKKKYVVFLKLPSGEINFIGKL